MKNALIISLWIMASIILDGDIPDKWKKIANGALFVNEKPYLEYN